MVCADGGVPGSSILAIRQGAVVASCALASLVVLGAAGSYNTIAFWPDGTRRAVEHCCRRVADALLLWRQGSGIVIPVTAPSCEKPTTNLDGNVLLN